MEDKWEEMATAAERACTSGEFLSLAKVAVSVYKNTPERDEAVAGRMTGIWLSHGEQWQNAAAQQIGELFADLDLPPVHVAGGKQGARRKWREIEELSRTTS